MVEIRRSQDTGRERKSSSRAKRVSRIEMRGETGLKVRSKLT